MGMALVFWLGEQAFGLPLETVERVLRAAAVTPLPAAPAIVCGALDLGGAVVPVIDPRPRVGQPSRPMAPADQLLLARTQGRRLVLWVDRTGDVVRWDPSELLPAAAAGDGAPPLKGIARGREGLILVLDLEGFLFHDEHLAVAEAAAHG